MAEHEKLNYLERAKAKAAYNYKKRLRDQKEERAMKEALASGAPLPNEFQFAQKEQPKEEKKGK